MPTTVVHSVGAVGRDYATLAAAETGEQKDRVVADVIDVFELYADADFTANLAINGSTHDATRYLIVRPATGEGWNPLTEAGVRIRQSAATQTINVNDEFTRILGPIFIEYTDTGSGKAVVIRVEGVLVREIFAFCLTGDPEGAIAFNYVSSSLNSRFESCIASGIGWAYGFDLTGTDNEVYNCSIAYTRLAGVRVQDASADLRNVAALDSTSTSLGDFDFSAATPGTVGNLVSSDTTASGVGQVNKTRVECFRDTGNFDFRVIEDGPLDAQGDNTIALFGDEAAFTTWNGTHGTNDPGGAFSVGAYDGAVPSPNAEAFRSTDRRLPDLPPDGFDEGRPNDPVMNFLFPPGYKTKQ